MGPPATSSLLGAQVGSISSAQKQERIFVLEGPQVTAFSSSSYDMNVSSSSYDMHVSSSSYDMHGSSSSYDMHVIYTRASMCVCILERERARARNREAVEREEREERETHTERSGGERGERQRKRYKEREREKERRGRERRDGRTEGGQELKGSHLIIFALKCSAAKIFASDMRR
jgi:hypothetical protein